jgi:acyl-CoA dehydrogenase
VRRRRPGDGHGRRAPALAKNGLRLNDTRDRAPLAVDDLRLDDDDRPADLERTAHRLDVAVPNRTEEARARLDGRGPGRAVGQVEVRAHSRGTICERHQRAAVHEASRSAQVLPPDEAGAHLAGRLVHTFDAEQAGQRHRLVPVDHAAILCDPRPIAIADPTAAAEFAELRADYRSFMEEHVYPKEAALGREDDAAQELIVDLRARAKANGLWAPHLPPEAGGTGRGFLAYAHLNEEIGRVLWAQYVFNCQAPDAGNGEILHLFGSDEQRERWLKPLVEGDARSFFSMTEPEVSGADPTGLRTTAVLDGNDWVINGHKWFSSGAEGAAFGIVMAVTEPDAEPRRRTSQIIVPADAPGIEIEPVPILGHRGRGWTTHCEVTYTDVRVPAENLLGERGAGFLIAQKRLGPGRIHHVMRWLGQMQRAFELMCKRALEREAFGGPLAEKQTVQNWIADSTADIQACRLLTLDAAHKVDEGRDARVEISLIKFFAADALSRVVDRAVQVHGALGLTDRSPLAQMYSHARGAHIYDGPDEVHRMVVSRRILEAFDQAGGWAFG